MARIAVVLVALMMLVSFPQSAFAEPETIEAAIQQVQQITNPDPRMQDRLRAAEAMRIVHNRLLTTNDASGLLFNTLPVDFWNNINGGGKTKTRDEFIEYMRNTPGWDVVKGAWAAKAGRCNEHAAVMAAILKGAGVNVTVLESDREGGHAFPVVDLAPGADPDVPWTWGKDAVVYDSWSGSATNRPGDLWAQDIYFGKGAHHVWSSKTRKPTRALIADMVARGSDYVKAHCDEYKKLMAKLQNAPPEARLIHGYNAPLDCDGFKKTAYIPTLVGIWNTSWGTLTVRKNPSTGKITGSYAYRMGKNSKTYAQGSLAGTESEGVFNGNWTERGGDKFATGKTTLTISDEGRKFSGPWHRTAGDSYESSGVWKGTRQTGPRQK